MNKKINTFSIKNILFITTILLLNSCSLFNSWLNSGVIETNSWKVIENKDFFKNKELINFKEEDIKQEKISSWEIVKSKEEIILKKEKQKKDDEKIKEKIKQKILEKNKKKKLEQAEKIKEENKYCILDLCLDKNKKIIDKQDKYIQNFYLDWKAVDYSYITKDKTYIRKIYSVELWWESESIKKIWNYYIRQKISQWCSISFEQKILDKNGKQVNVNITDLPNKIKLWNYNWSLNLNFKWDTFSFNKNDFIYFKKIINNKQDLLNEIKKHIDKNKKVYKKYYFKNKYGIYVSYSSNLKQSQRYIYLWNDKTWLKKAVRENWDFIDYDLTNKIIWYFGEQSSLWLVDSTWKRVLKVEKKNLPVFKVKKFDNRGHYLVYATNWYKFQSFVEMCKPAVYIYDNKQNSLNLTYNEWAYFTKLIPEFNINSWWNYKANNWKVEVNNDKFDYLYYAIKVPNYKHNKNWWIVYGENIEKFFLDKLDKINFNSKEKQDFLDYWVWKYDKDKYYFVSFKYKKDIDKLVKLNFKNHYKKEFRVLLDSYELENLLPSQKQFLYSKVWDKFDKYLIKRFDRTNNNEVFEWWGVLIKKGKSFVY